MPDIDATVTEDLAARLRRHLAAGGREFSSPIFLSAGGSAAVFRTDIDGFPRAIKAFDPKFFADAGGDAERRRLAIQRRLIGHSCPTLVQTYSVVEAEGTAFIEMEFVSWPQMTKVLPNIPDGSIAPLFSQLVDAVKFLESYDLVHRDIKPENIHISEDFSGLKLLDLGVTRETESSEGADAAVTDQGNKRPFLATAQYSSPEYLFRLDEPSPKLWRGLNFYQLGAVLHDMIMKRSIFDAEMQAGNRWLIAKAVLSRAPSFSDGQSARLANLKALASRCLVKDLDSRLALVGWEDFILEGASDPLTALRAKLAQGRTDGKTVSGDSLSRLGFDRGEFIKRFCERVRLELLPICGTSLPLILRPSAPGQSPSAEFSFALSATRNIICILAFEWLEHHQARSANISLRATICCDNCLSVPPPEAALVAVASITENESEAATTAAGAIAKAIIIALDRSALEGVDSELHGLNLLKAS